MYSTYPYVNSSPLPSHFPRKGVWKIERCWGIYKLTNCMAVLWICMHIRFVEVTSEVLGAVGYHGNSPSLDNLIPFNCFKLISKPNLLYTDPYTHNPTRQLSFSLSTLSIHIYFPLHLSLSFSSICVQRWSGWWTTPFQSWTREAKNTGLLLHGQTRWIVFLSLCIRFSKPQNSLFFFILLCIGTKLSYESTFYFSLHAFSFFYFLFL